MAGSWLERIAHLLGDLIFPPRCIGCQHAGPLLCTSCQQAILRFPTPRCARCDLPLALLHGTPLSCDNCAALSPALHGMRVVGPHAEPLRSAIHELKYQRRRALAAPLGELLVERWQYGAQPAPDGVLPVPLHPRREQERGFNQAALLAESVSHELARPLRPELLLRQRATVPQVGLTRQERLHNVAGAFSASEAARGGRWLLVDDVCTTGATLTASAQALKDAGAAEVWALVLARAYHPRPERLVN